MIHGTHTKNTPNISLHDSVLLEKKSVVTAKKILLLLNRPSATHSRHSLMHTYKWVTNAQAMCKPHTIARQTTKIVIINQKTTAANRTEKKIL